MEVKSLRTLNTIHLKLPPFPPSSPSKVVFCATLYTLPASFRGSRGGLFGRAIAKVDIMLHLHTWYVRAGRKVFIIVPRIFVLHCTQYTNKFTTDIFFHRAKFPKDYSKHWSSVGCEKVKSTDEFTICHCSHLTSYGLIMDVHNIYVSI